jgi:enediyne biosynthesis protein E4
MSRKKYLFRPFWLGIVILTALIGGIYNNVISTHPFQYSNYKKNAPQISLDYQLINESDLLKIPKYERKFFWNREPRYTLVGDVDNDGYEDAIIIGREREKKASTVVRLLLNKKGQVFEERSIQKEIYESSSLDAFPSAAALFDIDNDGFLDLAVSFDNGVVKFFKNKDGKFLKNKSWIDFHSTGDKRSIVFFDANNDGFLDVYFGSYFDLTVDSIISTSFHGQKAGKNVLLLNQGGEGFKDVTAEWGIEDPSYTWTTALADFDGDGFIDIINVNDFGLLTNYRNIEGKFFRKLDRDTMDERTASYNMSGEVADFNQDGKMDVYVSNTNKFPLTTGNNKLLINRDGKFKNASEELNVESCGWSWGARAFDPENNNNLALFVVASPNWSENQNFRLNLLSIPYFLKNSLANFLYENIPMDFFRFTIVERQSNCFFYKKDGQYQDIASSFGAELQDGGRSIAEIDFNNDGASDFVISNMKKSATLLRGNYKGINKWIGLDLQGTRSNRDAIGATITAEFNDGKVFKQVMPTNGYHSQSTKRIKFGLKESSILNQITIRWPSGQNQIIKGIPFNSYTRITEPN